MRRMYRKHLQHKHAGFLGESKDRAKQAVFCIRYVSARDADGIEDSILPVLREGIEVKYNNRKLCVDGIKFDSAREANRWWELRMLEQAGEITDLARQVKYELIPAQYKDKKCIERGVSYIADFVYVMSGKTIVEDVKGCRTKEYIIKRKLMLWVHGIRVREV